MEKVKKQCSSPLSFIKTVTLLCLNDRLAQVGYIKLFIICIFLSFLIFHLYLLF